MREGRDEAGLRPARGTARRRGAREGTAGGAPGGRSGLSRPRSLRSRTRSRWRESETAGRREPSVPPVVRRPFSISTWGTGRGTGRGTTPTAFREGVLARFPSLCSPVPQKIEEESEQKPTPEKPRNGFRGEQEKTLAEQRFRCSPGRSCSPFGERPTACRRARGGPRPPSPSSRSTCRPPPTPTPPATPRAAGTPPPAPRAARRAPRAPSPATRRASP